MNYRQFGNTDLQVSEIGFGAWAIGGASKLGGLPIGWGRSNDTESVQALETALDQGINFFDTADFYGLGHSEELIGKVFGNNPRAIIATKLGQKPGVTTPVEIDYSNTYMVQACEASLKRLRRDYIDYYQLHVATLQHLQQGDCIETMLRLQEQGKIRYWGLSLSTFNPFPEAEFMLANNVGNGFQLVLNIINQKSIPLLKRMHEKGYGVIARMPLQFGLLSGKFTSQTSFEETDHRSFRLTPEIIERANSLLAEVWLMAEKYSVSKTALALGFILSFPEISTTIPGIRSVEQATENARPVLQLKDEEKKFIELLYEPRFMPLLAIMQQRG